MAIECNMTVDYGGLLRVDIHIVLVGHVVERSRLAPLDLLATLLQVVEGCFGERDRRVQPIAQRVADRLGLTGVASTLPLVVDLLQ